MSHYSLNSHATMWLYKALERLDIKMMEEVFQADKDLLKNSGNTFFFLLDSMDHKPLSKRVACAKVLLKYYKEPLHDSETINEIKRIEKEKNIKRVNDLMLCLKNSGDKGKYECMNIDICELIYKFL